MELAFYRTITQDIVGEPVFYFHKIINRTRGIKTIAQRIPYIYALECIV